MSANLQHDAVQASMVCLSRLNRLEYAAHATQTGVLPECLPVSL